MTSGIGYAQVQCSSAGTDRRSTSRIGHWRRGVADCAVSLSHRQELLGIGHYGGLVAPERDPPASRPAALEELVIRDSEVYTHATPGSYLGPHFIPDTWRVAWQAASPEHF